MGVGWREVYSGVVREVGHDAERGELHVRWSDGRVSVYGGVNSEEAAAIIRAPSVGSAIWGLRRFGHAHRYAD